MPSNRNWLYSQVLRLASVIVCAMFAGASLLGVIQAQSVTVNVPGLLSERVAKTEYQSELNQQNLERVIPRVDHLEVELGKLYGIGLAVSVILGMLHAGQMVLTFKREREGG